MRNYNEFFKAPAGKHTRLRLKPDHPCYSRLAAAFVFQEGEYDEVIDLKNGIVGTNEDRTIVTNESDHKGTFGKFDNATGSGTKYGYDLGTPEPLQISNDITMLAGIYPFDRQSANWGRVYSQTNGTTGDNVGMTLSDVSDLIQFRINNDGLLMDSGITLEEYHDIACRYTSGDRSIWVDGENVKSDSKTGTIITSGNRKIGNHGSATARGFRGHIHYLYIFDAFLTDAEIMSFHMDPYQIVDTVGEYFIKPAVAPVTPEFVAKPPHLIYRFR